MDVEGMNLNSLYNDGWRLWKESEENNDVCIEGVDKFTKAAACISRAALFSRGETIEDLSTISLKYISVPFFIGDLLQKIPDFESRENNLKRAEDYFTSFLDMLDQYEILTKEDREVFKRESEVKTTSENIRKEVIERELRAKKINEKLMVIMERRRKGDIDSIDEEVEREVALSALELHVLSAIKSIRLIKEELPMLEIMNKMKKTGVTELPGPPAKRIDLWGPRQKPTKKVIRDTVFKPGWNLATISPEQAAEMEMRHMVKGGGNDPNSVVKKYGDEDSMGYIRGKTSLHSEEKEDSVDSEDDDESVMKKREWDEFNDENPTGWGNRHNKG